MKKNTEAYKLFKLGALGLTIYLIDQDRIILASYEGATLRLETGKDNLTKKQANNIMGSLKINNCLILGSMEV